jgi:hypothetical protein
MVDYSRLVSRTRDFFVVFSLLITLMTFVACGESYDQKLARLSGDIDKIFTKDEYFALTNKCLPLVGSAEGLRTCKEEVILPKVQKYCNSEKLSSLDCQNFKELVTQRELEYNAKMQEQLREEIKKK